MNINSTIILPARELSFDVSNAFRKTTAFKDDSSQTSTDQSIKLVSASHSHHSSSTKNRAQIAAKSIFRICGFNFIMESESVRKK